MRQTWFRFCVAGYLEYNEAALERRTDASLMVSTLFHRQALASLREEECHAPDRLEEFSTTESAVSIRNRETGQRGTIKVRSRKAIQPEYFERATDRTEHYAAHLKDSATSLFLFASMKDILKDVDPASYRRLQRPAA